MTIIFSLFVFIFGLIVGSFLNCIIYRTEQEESFLGGRSKCPKCQHSLNWKDLVPVFSFLFLKGKCHYCREKISWQYPLVELLTAFLFLTIFNYQLPIFNEFLIINFQNLFTVLCLFLISCFLVLIFVYDLKKSLIPDMFIYPAIIISIIYQLFSGGQTFLNLLLAILIGSGLFLFIFLISRGKWIGFGDVTLGLFMGLFLGFPNIIVALFLGVFLGAIIGLGLMFFKKKNISSEIPFGPFLITGTVISFLFGSQIINWYLKFLI